jgi:hypothetical protein
MHIGKPLRGQHKTPFAGRQNVKDTILPSILIISLFRPKWKPVSTNKYARARKKS